MENSLHLFLGLHSQNALRYTCADCGYCVPKDGFTECPVDCMVIDIEFSVTGAVVDLEGARNVASETVDVQTLWPRVAPMMENTSRTMVYVIKSIQVKKLNASIPAASSHAL